MNPVDGTNRQNQYIMVLVDYAAYVVRRPPVSIMVIWRFDTKRVEALYFRPAPDMRVTELTDPLILEPFQGLIKPTLEADPELWPRLTELLERTERHRVAS